ncbi:MAG: tetratricopeptide repeat protein [Melioribacteraceae bacterium]
MRRTHFLILLLFGSIIISAQVEKNLNNRFQLATSYEQAGQFDKAETIYREISAAQPWNIIYFESLNKILIAQKKYDQSLELLNERIRQNPGELNSYGLLGSSYFFLDQQDKAYDSWERGIAINRASPAVYRLIANYAVENRAFDKAVEFLKRGKDISGDPSAFSMDLANIYAANMKFRDATAELCILIVHHPEQSQTVKMRINNFIKGPGAFEQSVESVNEFIRSDSRLELYDLLTFIYQTGGNYQEAFRTAVTIEEKYSGNGTHIFNFAQEAYLNRQYLWASEGYNYIIKNYPKSAFIPTARIGYARTLESALDQRFILENESWKPYYKPASFFKEEYSTIIDSYNKFIKEFPDNLIRLEAYFRIAEIFRNRLFDYHKADSVYKRISEFSPVSEFYLPANISRGIMALERNDLGAARNFFELIVNSPRADQNNLTYANYYLARIEFWSGNFSSANALLNSVSRNTSTDFANDALELSTLISTSRKDSLNLLLYARADLLALQNKHKEASVEFKTLSDNPNLFIINDFAKIKFAEMLIAENELTGAIEVLEDLLKTHESSIFADKSTFLLAECYQFGTKDPLKAAQTYQKLLETFPNSLYFDRAREALLNLPTKNG